MLLPIPELDLELLLPHTEDELLPLGLTLAAVSALSPLSPLVEVVVVRARVIAATWNPCPGFHSLAFVESLPRESASASDSPSMLTKYLENQEINQ